MVIMGIDSSTTSTGWAVIETKFEGKLRLIECGTIIPPKNLSMIKRIVHISRALKLIITRYRPEFVTLEEMNVTRNMKTMRALVGLITEIEVVLINRNALYVKFTPSEWRKKVGIRCKNEREELKRASVEYVWEHFREKVGDDEADAVCIAEAGSKMEVEIDADAN